MLRMGGYAAGLPGRFNAIGDEPAESRSVATVKDANLANPLTSEEDMRPSPQGLGKERDATHSAPRG